MKVTLFFDVLIPGAMFLGIIVGLGRLQNGYEITAMAAAGVGRRSVVRAVLVIALGGLVLVGLLTHVFRPWAYEHLYRMEGEMAARIDLTGSSPAVSRSATSSG